MSMPPKPRHAPEPHFKLDRMQKPTGPMPPWPRPGTRRTVRVGGADTWGSIATGWAVGDVWDLISWNFGTATKEEPTPREVNWFMHHFIGCWRATSDGKNFRFIEADPGFIHIPPLGWSRNVPGLPFHTMVALAISKIVPNYPVLSFAPFAVEPRDLFHVRRALHDGLLGAQVDPALADPAQYNPDDNILFFRNGGTGSFDSRLNIVHETTHAVLDRRFAGFEMRRWQNEFIAYTAEALWAWNNDASAARMLLDRTDVSDSAKAAIVLGHYLRGGISTKKVVSDFDKDVADFRDTSRTLNPVAELKRAIRRDMLGNGDDPAEKLLMSGWLR